MPPAARRFATLPAQVASALREEILQGTWSEWLPGERSLTSTFQVSRKTLRKALAQLTHEGRIEAVRGLGNRIVAPARAKRRAAQTEQLAALLTPDPLERMRPYTSLWVGHLKSLLIEHGVRLLTFDGRKFFSRRPAKALERLAAQQAISCWLLANSTRASQQWFVERRLPCVIAGSCHPGIDLPNADLDHYALCRHAAGVLLGAGHRHVALLNERSDRAGDIESEAGFIAGVRESPHRDAREMIVHHDHTPASLARAVQRLLDAPSPPTALLVSHSAGYLTIMSVLAQRKLRVPQDVSVVSRDDEPFLSFLLPTPARYTANPKALAKRLLKPILQSLRGEPVVPRNSRILPTYTRGDSLAAPAARSPR